MSGSAGDLPRIGWHFLRARRAFTHLRGENLRAYQDRRAREIVRFAAERSPFYRARWGGSNLADWRILPTIDKRAMMEHFDHFNTVGLTRDEAMAAALRAEQSRDFTPTVGKRVTVGLSSGTSGHRGLFVVSPAESAAWAGTILARVFPRLPSSGYRIALFLRSNSNLYERLGASRRVIFRWFDLMTGPEEAVTALNSFAPQLLVGPPSLLSMLATAAVRGTLRIRPKRLLSVAEVLEPQDRERLESVFGAPVGQIYQCTEGLLAVTCPHGRLHIQEDLVAIQYEPLSPNDPTGVTPVVTDLWRRTQPIVRYRLGDVLRLTPSDIPECPCGSTFASIDSIEGRCDDLCWFPGEEPEGETMALRPFFPDTIRRMVLLADADIEDYAAVQERPGHLRLFLEVKEGTSFDKVAAAVRESAIRIVVGYGCLALQIEIEPGLPAADPMAKRRRVRCLHEERS